MFLSSLIILTTTGALVGDDGDEQQDGGEDGQGADRGDDPVGLRGVVVADEPGDDLRLLRALPGGQARGLHPRDQDEGVGALHGVLGQDAHLPAVALGELVGGHGGDEIGHGRRGQVLARTGSWIPKRLLLTKKSGMLWRLHIAETPE